jgi:hypothetical protein
MSGSITVPASLNTSRVLGIGAYRPTRIVTNDEIVGASTTGSSNEFVELIGPPDGDYQIWVQGWSVTGNPVFELAIDAIHGSDMTISGLPDGAVPAGTPVTMTVQFARTMAPGEDYFGELLLGPPSAPTALVVPIQITRQ